MNNPIHNSLGQVIILLSTILYEVVHLDRTIETFSISDKLIQRPQVKTVRVGVPMDVNKAEWISTCRSAIDKALFNGPFDNVQYVKLFEILKLDIERYRKLLVELKSMQLDATKIANEIDAYVKEINLALDSTLSDVVFPR